MWMILYLLFFLCCQDMAAAQAEQAYSTQVPRTASSATLPPSYDALLATATASKPQPCSSEPPPPTYEEAMYLIDDEKVHVNNRTNVDNKQEASDQTDTSVVSSKP